MEAAHEARQEERKKKWLLWSNLTLGKQAGGARLGSELKRARSRRRWT
jgi:hypothetical protein